MRKIEVEKRNLELLCASAMNNAEVAVALGVGNGAVPAICQRHGVKTPHQRNKERARELAKQEGTNAPEPKYELYGMAQKVNPTSTFEERIAVQPPLKRVAVEHYEPPDGDLNVSQLYREIHKDVVEKEVSVGNDDQ